MNMAVDGWSPAVQLECGTKSKNMANTGGSCGLMVASLLAPAACADPERSPPQASAVPSPVDLAPATAGATRAQVGGLDHLQAPCARDGRPVRSVGHAAAVRVIADNCWTAIGQV